eukprot:SAG31_NODE_303_length_18065_cov_5.733107_6_plen_83_part_00
MCSHTSSTASCSSLLTSAWIVVGAASVLAKTACTCLRISALGFKTTIGPSTLERMKVEAERMLARRADIVNEHGVRQSQAVR